MRIEEVSVDGDPRPHVQVLADVADPIRQLHLRSRDEQIQSLSGVKKKLTQFTGFINLLNHCLCFWMQRKVLRRVHAVLVFHVIFADIYILNIN